MIDPHVHLRDWKQSSKETVKHGLHVAGKAGLTGVFEMPNTNPALTSRDSLVKRIELADRVIEELGIQMFHGMYAGLTNDVNQIEEVVKAHNELFPRVVGLKMYAGHSTGNMGIVDEEPQQLVYHTLTRLDYRGVLAVHCEKESHLRPELWNPSKPYTHTIARPAKAEVESVKDQIRFAEAAGFGGTLHICHISVAEALEEVEKARKNCKITCGITPHHAMLHDGMMQGSDGILYKMNPPLRTEDDQQYMLQALLSGRIDWLETDHAPHTLKDKKEGYASGIPGFPYYPHFIQYLRQGGMPEQRIREVTHGTIEKIFGIKVAGSRGREFNNPEFYNLADEYEFDVWHI